LTIIQWRLCLMPVTHAVESRVAYNPIADNWRRFSGARFKPYGTDFSGSRSELSTIRCQKSIPDYGLERNLIRSNVWDQK